MYSVWTKHLKDPQDIERFKQTVQHSKVALDRLNEIMLEMEEMLDTSEQNAKIYEIPNWDYRQADNIGYRRALKHIRRLISLDQKDNNGQLNTTD